MPRSDSLTTKSAFVTGGRFVNASMRFIVTLAIARIFADQVALYGDYQTVWLPFNTCFLIFLFGIPQSIYYFYPRSDYSQRGAFVRHTVILLHILGAIFFIFLFFTAPYTGRLYKAPHLVSHFHWFAVYGFAMVSSGFFDTLFIVMNRHRWQAVVMASEALLFFCVTVIPIVLGAALITVFKCVTGLALVKWAFVLGVLATERREFRLTWALPQWEKIKAQLVYAAPLGLTAAAGYLSIYLDKNIIRGYFESDTYAIYFLGAMEFPLVAIVLSAINNVLVPEISRMHHEGQVQGISGIWQRAIKKTSLLVLPLWVFLMIWAIEGYVLFCGEPYRASSLIFRIYLLKLPLRITAYNMVLSVIGYPNLVFRIALAEMSINAVLSLAFVRWLGMPGPAIATVIATYFQVVVLTRTIRMKLGLRVRDIFPWRHLLKVLMLGLLAGGISLIAYTVPSPSLLSVDSKFQSDLNSNSISEELRQEFEDNGISLSDSANVSIKEQDSKWLVSDKDKAYSVRKWDDKLDIQPASYWPHLIIGGALFGIACLVLFWRSGDIALLLNLRRL